MIVLNTKFVMHTRRGFEMQQILNCELRVHRLHVVAQGHVFFSHPVTHSAVNMPLEHIESSLTYILCTYACYEEVSVKQLLPVLSDLPRRS